MEQYYTFLLNNQPDALIIQIVFCYKTLHVSGTSLPIIWSSLL